MLKTVTTLKQAQSASFYRTGWGLMQCDYSALLKGSSFEASLYNLSFVLTPVLFLISTFFLVPWEDLFIIVAFPKYTKTSL